MGRSTVDLVEYSDTWPGAFQAERHALLSALGPRALVVEHIGSTSVPGLVAKPTIDIAVGVRTIDDVHACRSEVEGLGYEVRGGFHDEHLMARKIVEDERTHHLHFRVYPSQEFADWIMFRDLLRRDPEAQRAYAEEKTRLAARFYDGRGSYVEAKTAIVERLLERARRQPR